MAASSNESFGLKIATAFSIALAVVLLVSVYFLNSNYNLEYEKRAKADAEVGKVNGLLRTANEQVIEYRGLIGYPAIEDFESAKAQIKKDTDQIKSDISAINTEVGTMVAEFQKKAEGKGADASQFEALKQRGREVVDSFLTNPDQSYKSSLGRLKDLTVNQAKLTTALALNYIDIRRDLELANKVNSDQKKVVEDGLATARTELDSTIKKDEDARQELVADVRKKAEDIANIETRLTNLTNESGADLNKRDKTIAQISAVLRDIQDLQAQKEDVMSKPGGRVTFVDYGSNIVRVSVNKRQGVRPLMRFTIFDKNAAGITSDRPKAAVELIKVTDTDSEARIVKTYDTSDPIRYNDFIFSVGWSYDHPQRFDLIGKIDINRDGKDDRADLIRMIEGAGGVIEYDLPPPNVDRGPGIAAVARGYARLGQPVPPSVGRAAGKISGLSFAYVIDRRTSTVLYQAKKGIDAAKDDTDFLQSESQATKEARDNAVRPLPLEKLLNMLGYDYSMPIEGRREAFDRPAVKQLLAPKPPAPGRPSGATVPPAADTPPAADAPK